MRAASGLPSAPEEGAPPDCSAAAAGVADVLSPPESDFDAELEQALRDAKQDLWGARFALSTRQLKDYSTIPLTRRTIARILTVQRERKLGKTA